VALAWYYAADDMVRFGAAPDFLIAEAQEGTDSVLLRRSQNTTLCTQGKSK